MSITIDEFEEEVKESLEAFVIEWKKKSVNDKIHFSLNDTDSGWWNSLYKFSQEGEL